MSIEKLIQDEKEYFRPMLEREGKTSEEQKLMWRAETVRERSERVSLEVFDMLSGSVKYGPFAGMKLKRDTWWGKSDLGSMLLGLYEKEILDYIDSVEDNSHSCFIDIGAADGYYACGLLFSGKFKKAICFERSEHGQAVIESNWKLNGALGELQVYGDANPQSINDLSSEDLKNAFVLIDVEGHEFDLLTETNLEKLNACVIIIEIHNWIEDFILKYENLLRRVSEHFYVEVLPRSERPTFSLSELRDFTDDNRLLLVSERRPCVMRFLKLTPRT